MSIEIKPSLVKIINKTFSVDTERLPSINDLKKSGVVFDDWHNDCPFESTIFRSLYICKSFVLLSEDWLQELCIFTRKFRRVAELSAGNGWLTHWMRKYGQNVDGGCVDDQSWNEGNKTTTFNYQRWVKKKDSVQHVKDTPTVDLYILSWPYMDDVAFNIWEAMRPGQSLLYIGEDCGGCTANDNFFGAISRCEKDIQAKRVYKTFRAFWGVHDRPCLFTKR